nr:hypothetical protein Itr_chr12CG22450 [Ipomoea trifida]
MGEVCIGKGGFQVYGWQEAVFEDWIGWGSSNLCSLVGWIGLVGGQYIVRVGNEVTVGECAVGKIGKYVIIEGDWRA